MGHIPSKEFESVPFYFDIKSTHHALLALNSTNFNFNDNESLAHHYLTTRSIPSVQSWYLCDTLPANDFRPPPQPAEIDASTIKCADLIYAMNLPPERYVPMPVAVLRMRPELVEEGKWENWTPSSQNSSVVGYFGLRSFNRKGELFERAQVGIWLDKTLQNDTKADAVIKAAAKCYEVFYEQAVSAAHPMDKIGLGERNNTRCSAPWPKEVSFKTWISNYPCLALIDKVWSAAFASFARPENDSIPPLVVRHGTKELWEGEVSTPDDSLSINIDGGRIYYIARGRILRQSFELLASQCQIKPTETQGFVSTVHELFSRGKLLHPCYEIKPVLYQAPRYEINYNVSSEPMQAEENNFRKTLQEINNINGLESFQKYLVSTSRAHWQKVNEPVKNKEIQLKAKFRCSAAV